MSKFMEINQRGNQRGIVFVPILVWTLVAMTGIGLVSEITGHHISFSNSSTIERSNPPLLSQGLAQTLPASPSTSSNFDYQGAKAAGYSDAEIQNYLASKSQNKNSVTPKPQVTKASDKALRLAAYIFTASNEDQKNGLESKFSNGKNDLKQAINNMALLLDSKPEVLTLAEKVVSQDIVQRSAKKTQDDNDKVLEYHQKELERIENQNESLGVYSQDYTYVGKTQNTNIEFSLPKKTEVQNISSLINNVSNPPSLPVVNSYKGPTKYDIVGDTAYGSDGSRYYKVGNSVYKNDGTRYDAVGDTLYGNDGSRYYQVGDSVYKNDGTRYDTVGDTVYGSDGSRYYQVGDSIYAQPGY